MNIINKEFVSRLVILFLLVSYNIDAQSQNKIQSKNNVAFQELVIEKSFLKSDNKVVPQNYKLLIKTADSLLHIKSFSVVNKTGVPPSGDKHDYMSIGPYWWPNPETNNGLPYIRKDGEVNPETRNNYTDFVESKNFINAIKSLTRAYDLSDNKAYGIRAKELITVWFLDAATKMNPNVNYGQSIPGKNDGRCFGIIEFSGLVDVITCLELLEDKKILDDKTKSGMEFWLSEYAHWLLNSKLGKEQATRKNNHGTHYDVQLLSILLYLNEIEEVKNYLSTTTKARIFSQIEPDGSQPLELKRTKSFSYSSMNLHGFMKLVRLGEKIGVHLWNFKSEDGRSLKKAYQYMVPYLTKEKEWKYQQISSVISSEDKLIEDLNYVSKTLKDSSFDKALEHLQQHNTKH